MFHSLIIKDIQLHLIILMARADLLLQLVQSGTKGDRALFRKTVEAIIAEEKSKRHNVFASQLEQKLNENNSSNGQHSSLTRNDNKIDNVVSEILPQVLLQDLMLSQNTLELCEEFITEQLRADLLRSYNLEPRSKILLVGPPGNGKTSLAEAIANSLMVPMFTVRYEGLIASYLGETASRLKYLFDFIKTQRCVLFFDEFDAIGKERGDQHETGEIKRVVNTLLLQIDALPSHVVVISATNHPELLDKAVWRRFQIKIPLPKPSAHQIQDYLKKFETNFKISLGVKVSVIAGKLKDHNFSEVEDFAKDILRTHILRLPSLDIKKITQKRITQIKESYKPSV